MLDEVQVNDIFYADLVEDSRSLLIHKFGSCMKLSRKQVYELAYDFLDLAEKMKEDN